MPVCPFEVLGLHLDASPSEIESAWRRLSLECHPDKRPHDPRASANFQALTQAKDDLLDPQRRANAISLRRARRGGMNFVPAPRQSQKVSRNFEPSKQRSNEPKDDDPTLHAFVRRGSVKSSPRHNSDKREAEPSRAKINVQIFSLSSQMLADLDFPGSSSVWDVKMKLEEVLQTQTFRQRLTCRRTSRDMKDTAILDDLPKPCSWTLILSKCDLEADAKLLDAARHGHEQVVAGALARNANPNCAKGTDKVTPLLLAIMCGSSAVAEHLLSRKADINMISSKGESPLILAAAADNAAIVQKLCDARADSNVVATDGDTPLSVAATNGCLASADILIRFGANKDTAALHGGTPLYHASRNGHLELVQFLCELGACKDSTAQNGETPLFIAAAMNRPAVVNFLCQSSADVDKPAQFDDTPFKMAMLQGHAEVLRILRDAGARTHFM